ncbi:MAG: prolyl oligopeptidase family serine peptidase [Dehalococcoidia bacterium]|nr:prolyl oligopeptidase family serine peptidase [Dehalococcoidia bacterium]
MPAATVEDFVRVESATGVSFASDGLRLAFRSNRSGVYQAYVTDLHGEDAQRAQTVAETEGTVYQTAFRPGHAQVLFVTDDGGDEQYQLHLADLDAGTARPLGSEARVIHNLGAWSLDGRLLSYASNRRDRRYFDIYVLDVESGRERLVLQQDGMNAAGRFNASATALLVSRPNLEQPGDNDLYLLDIEAGGEPRRLTAHDGPAHWADARFHAGGAVLALSDEGREFVGLQRIDPTTGKRAFVLERDWDIEAFALSSDGQRLAVAVNEDGFSRLEAFSVDADGRPGAPLDVPAVPGGVISSLEWRPEAAALAFTFESAHAVSDVWLADLDRRGLRRLTRSDMRSIKPTSLPDPEVVRYPTFDGGEVPAFLYRPLRRASEGALPCLVLVHGGPESQSRPFLWGSYAAAAYLLHQGRLAVLVPNVRGSTGYGKAYHHADDVERRMDSVRDLIAARQWLAGSGVADPARIGVMGGSYGGFMTLAAITEAPEDWAAAVDLFGIANFLTFLEHTGPWRRRPLAAEYGSDTAFLESISPIHKADRIRTPLLVVQGDHDVRVPPEESEQIVQTVRRNEGVVEYVVFEREGHGIQRLPNRLELARRTVAFLERYLLPGE